MRRFAAPLARAAVARPRRAAAARQHAGRGRVGSSGLLLGGLTTWLGMLAALWALLAPRRPGDVAGAAAVVAVARAHPDGRRVALAPAHAPGGLLGVADVAAPAMRPPLHGALSLIAAPRRTALPAHAAFDGAAGARSGARALPAPAGGVGRRRRAGARPPHDARHARGAAAGAHRAAPARASRTDVITLHAELLERRGARRRLAGERRVLGADPRIGRAGRGAVPRAVDARLRTKDGAPSWRLARQQALF